MRMRGPRGIRLPDYREAVLAHPIETPEPADRLYLPVPERLLEQIIPGEALRRGQVLWESDVHLPVLCPADGRIADVVRLSHPLFGDHCYVVLDGLRRPGAPIPLPGKPTDLAEKARLAGILDETDGVPLYAKLKHRRAAGGTLVADATAADPYMAAAVGVLQEDPALVLRGLQLAAGYVGAAAYGVAVTAGSDGGKHVTRALGPHRFVASPRYPTDRLAPARRPRPVEVMGVQALAALARAEEWNEAADGCVVTVHGDAVSRPRNLRVLTGTPAAALLAHCGAAEDALPVIGGAMTGLPCDTAQLPVSAGVTCLLAMARTPEIPPAPCSGCGACIQVCHRGLAPGEIARRLENMQYDLLPVLEPQRCDGCGACSYICPAKRDVTGAVLEAASVQGTIFMDLEGGE